MKNSTLCVYCKSSGPFNKEHVIPRAFGKFFDPKGQEAVIVHRVCRACNSSFSSFEQSHSRESLDVFFRNRADVKGRRPKERKPSPYRMNKEGGRAVTLYGTSPHFKQPILMELIPEVGIIEQPSVQFINQKSGKPVVIELTPYLTREELERKLKNLGYAQDVELTIFCRPDEVKRIEKLFEKEKLRLNSPPPPYPVRTRIEGKYSKNDFRSIAKIAFNYVMKFNTIGLTGHEAWFEEVRAFIRHGTNHVSNFCFFPNLGIAPTEFNEPCHLIRFDANEHNGLMVRMHLFASRNYQTPLHTVRLSSYPFRIHLPHSTIGHCFKIKPGETDSGELTTLSNPQVSIPDSPIRPLPNNPS